ncbi:MAG TPA: di-trans,poly-cis-decaprenylcistransferase [Myxococcales bacterium]|nr:di-trans,poly-cis-decaprenylcistransferase [Myxococcales bacterium]HBU48263.1 di-trans,poly-cis-decaprenylcistransferase [Myxococcales bacterium]|tara:strand:+ start:922 stop:1596 length:675 start_codon:yes stop_codon:yes gene_type:complete
MDGNGRWAEARGFDRSTGHREGAKAVRTIVTRAREKGVQVLTLYAFSTENWRRPKREIGQLMTLLTEFLLSERTTLLKNQIALRAIGRPADLPKSVTRLLNALMADTANNAAMTLNLALSYGSKAELVDAFESLRKQGGPIDENRIEDALQTRGQPPVDLLIRTGGEQRLSNFLLWQAAYAELLFTHTLWPDFNSDHFDAALDEYGCRERRFGKTGAQMQGATP